jgi:hypothetical protein
MTVSVVASVSPGWTLGYRHGTIRTLGPLPSFGPFRPFGPLRPVRSLRTFA